MLNNRPVALSHIIHHLIVPMHHILIKMSKWMTHYWVWLKLVMIWGYMVYVCCFFWLFGRLDLLCVFLLFSLIPFCILLRLLLFSLRLTLLLLLLRNLLHRYNKHGDLHIHFMIYVNLHLFALFEKDFFHVEFHVFDHIINTFI